MRVTEHSGVTLVSALYNGIGITLGLDLKLNVEIVLGEGKIKGGMEDTQKLLDNVFAREGLSRKNFDVIITSEIPPSVGLKSSSSFMLALLNGIQHFKESRMNEMETIVKSCIYSKELGISYTGAMDDAIAVHFGGLNMVDNIKFSLMEHYDVIPQNIIVSVPGTIKKRVGEDELKLGVRENQEALKMARLMNFGEAALLNSQAISESFGYDISIIIELRKLKGVKIAGYSGTGPSFYAIYENDEKLEKNVIEYFQNFGDYIIGRIR